MEKVLKRNVSPFVEVSNKIPLNHQKKLKSHKMKNKSSFFGFIEY